MNGEVSLILKCYITYKVNYCLLTIKEKVVQVEKENDKNR